MVTYYATAAGAGGAPEVKVFDANETAGVDFLAYDASFRGGVRVATGDVNGDGYPDIITVPGPGGGPNVRILRQGRLAAAELHGLRSPAHHGPVRRRATPTATRRPTSLVAPIPAPAPTLAAVFDGTTGNMLKNFFAYNSHFTAACGSPGGRQ